MKTKRTKGIVIFFIAIFGLSPVAFLINNSNMKRHIVIENRTSYGVVLINNVKYKTPYQTQQTQIGVNCDNALDFLFLSTEDQQDSYIGSIAKLVLGVIAITLVWQLDFNDPFQKQYSNRLSSIFILYVIVVSLAWVRVFYTEHWVSSHLPGSGYSYRENITGTILYFTIIMFGALLNLYYRAVKNKEELELTI